MRIVFCRGIQGSGKSTYAKKWVQEDLEHRVRINFDDMRLMLGGGIDGYWVPKREKANFVVSILDGVLTTALVKGFDVIIDNMNLSEKSINQVKEYVDTYNRLGGNGGGYPNIDVEYEEIWFKTPLEECIARDAKRECPVGENIIRHTYNRYKYLLEDETSK